MKNMKICELLDGRKGSVNGFGSKMDPLSEAAKSVTPVQHRIKGLVESWGGASTESDGQVVKKEWLLVFGIGENPHEGYFETFKIVEELFKEKMGMHVSNRHFGSVARLQRRKGAHPVFVRFTYFSKICKMEVFSRILTCY
jgi:hypothetical protein